MMYGYDGFLGGGGFGLFSGFLMIIFWGVIIYFFIQVVTQNGPKKESKSPMEILKDRYAKGEITKAEFDEMKKDLM